MRPPDLMIFDECATIPPEVWELLDLRRPVTRVDYFDAAYRAARAALTPKRLPDVRRAAATANAASDAQPLTEAALRAALETFWTAAPPSPAIYVTTTASVWRETLRGLEFPRGAYDQSA